MCDTACLQADRATSALGKQTNRGSAELTFEERINLRRFFDLLVE